jgi:hypothetical protein
MAIERLRDALPYVNSLFASKPPLGVDNEDRVD